LRLSEHIEGDGPIIFDHASKMGPEGIVSKRRDLPYRSGRVRSWIKVKNPASPAMRRITQEGASSSPSGDCGPHGVHGTLT
jgi:ATP-dependent DNA ligase